MCKKTTFLARVNRQIPDIDVFLMYYVQTKSRDMSRICCYSLCQALNNEDPMAMMVMQYLIPCIILGPAPDSMLLLAAEAVMVVL